MTGRRRAAVRTTHDAPAAVAAALRPDNTDAMRTRVEADAVVTTIERPSTGGLQSTADDYVVNLQVATAVRRHATGTATGTEPTSTTDADTATDTDTDTDTDQT